MIDRRQLLAAAAALPLIPAVGRSLTTAHDPDVMRFVFSRPFDNPRTQWLIRVYTDLVGELGKRFEFVEVPPRRATAMVLLGEVDGELGRTFEYQTLYPALVRVPEPNNPVRFAAYALRPELQFDNWQAVRARKLRCEYRHGISELQSMLSRELAPGQFSYVQTIAQGLQKLRLHRTDLYFDVEEAVSDYLFFLSDAERNTSGLQRLHEAGVVRATTGHAYLHSSHAALAPQLAAGLARLKRQGIVKRYLTESLATHKKGLAPDAPAAAVPR